MQKTNNILLKVTALMAVALFSVSCLLEKEDAVEKMRNVMIELNVSADPMTKAAVSDQEGAINSLRIYAFDGERLAGYISREAVDEGTPFYMDLELPESGLRDIYFYAIANEANMAYENGVVSLSENMTRSQLESIKFTGLNTAAALPMFAKQLETGLNVEDVKASGNSTEGHEGHFVLTKSVALELERSLAKISLYAAKAEGVTKDPQILSATLLSEGTRLYSYLYPQSPEVLNAIASRPNDRSLINGLVSVTSSVVPNTSDAMEPANFDLVFSNAYLPEVTYGSSDSNTSSGNSREVVIRVEYSLGGDGEIRNGYIYMPPIERNTHYKVCVLINAEGRIQVNYTVASWIDNMMNHLHFDYPTHSYLRMSIPLTEADLKEKPSGPALMSETQPFIGYFQMTYPSNDFWTPTLEGPNAGNCNVEVYKVDGLIETLVHQQEWPIASSASWYKVIVKPNPSKLTVGDEVRLAITYKATGFEESEYMLINGSHQEYYWPYTGSSIEDADYVIITMVN